MTIPNALPRARWLVLAHEEPPAVLLQSYAERLAGVLRQLGQEALLVRVRRGALPSRGRGVAWEVELPPIPLPRKHSNRLLARAIPLQRALAELVRTEGPFDALLCEGALGALVGPPLAARAALPLFLALPDCEAAARGTQLTREQLYLAELEHWGADRANTVLAPSRPVAEGIARYYEHQPRVVPVPVDSVAAPPVSAPLLGRLGVPTPYALVLAEELSEREGALLFAGPTELAVVWAGPDLWVRTSGHPPEPRARGRVLGPALGSLLASADVVLVHDRCPERRADAARLARRFAVLEPGAFAGGLRNVIARASGAPASDPTQALMALIGAVLAPGQREAVHEPALL